MLKHAIVGTAICMVSVAHTQVINVRGKITDAGNNPIANANVDLLVAKRKAATSTDGMYTLNSTGVAFDGPADFRGGKMALVQGMLYLETTAPAPIRIEIFSADGHVLDRTTRENAEAGTYRFDLTERAASDRLLFVRASVGSETKVFRFLRMTGGGAAAALQAFTPQAAAALAKVSAVVDTLQVSATGYAAKKVPITSYDTVVNVSLEASSDRWGGLKNPPGKSAGCGKATTVTNGKKTITSTNQQRTYIIDIPANYDMNKPYRLFYCSHWIGSTSEAVRDQNYYFLKPLATAANEPAIFIAPQSDGSTWQQKDHALFDDIMAFAKQNLCFDTTRVFATGFSFGGMITYSLSTNHQKVIRAAVGIAPANYNIWLPNPKIKEPIAWMQTTGMRDGTCPWVQGTSTTNGAKFIAIEKSVDNGCTPNTNPPTWTTGNHLCYDYQGCKAGYPTKACTFNGDHTNINNEGGTNWIPTESWKFFTQF